MVVLHKIQIDPLVTKALEEDWGYADWTTDICIPADKVSRATIIAKQQLLVSGVEVVEAVFEKVDPELKVRSLVANGELVDSKKVLLELEGSARSILKGERVALNFFGRMCGISTLTRQYVDKLEGTNTQLLDTRKTTPLHRVLEKTATAVGGARNHRFGLSDGVMLKENHIRAAGGIVQAVSSLLDSLPPTIKVEVETTNLSEVKEALEAGADIIMLDNMSHELMREAVKFVNGRVLLEASGNITLDTIKSVAECGVDFISSGSTIHSSKWADISLLFEV